MPLLHLISFFLLLNRHAKEEDLSELGSILVLIICDDDSGATLGISVVQAMEIPHLYAHIQSLSQGNIPERRKMTLTIFTQKESMVLKEMESRMEASDQDILDFYKRNRKVLEQNQIRKTTRSKYF